MLDISESLKAAEAALTHGRRADFAPHRATLNADAANEGVNSDQRREAAELVTRLDAAIQAGGAPAHWLGGTVARAT